jgi:hypothetical protein
MALSRFEQLPYFDVSIQFTAADYVAAVANSSLQVDRRAFGHIDAFFHFLGGGAANGNGIDCAAFT